MKKNLIRNISVVIVLVILVIIIFRNRSPFGKNNSSFASVPNDEITRIEFTENGNRLTLEKKGETWLINGKQEARKSGVLFILRVLEEIKIKSPVSPELFKKEVAEKNLKPVKVKVFEKSRLLNSFLVYKTGSNTYGNIMKKRDSSKPFIVFVPGYDGDIGSGFIANELFWQSYTIFNYLPSEISSVRFENFADKGSSFSITAGGHHFSLDNISPNVRECDSILVDRYISYFAWVPFEKWALGLSDNEKSAIESDQPLYRITVNSTTGKSKVLTMWERTIISNGIRVKDSDRLYGKTGERDQLFILRYFDIDPLIKKRTYFLKINSIFKVAVR